MLRWLIIALLLANLGYFGWTQGWMQEQGFAPEPQEEPFRLDMQIRPKALRVLTAAEIKRLEASAPPPKAPECLQAGLFTPEQAAALRQALDASLPASLWQFVEGVETGRWIVYMGPFASTDALTRKKGELRYLSIAFEPPRNPDLEPGLSLGSHDSVESAQLVLAQLARRGVRTARVVQERAEVRGEWARLPVVDDSLRSRLDDYKTLLAGKSWRACR